MKAIRVHEFGTPEVMQLENVAELHPTADQVLIRVKAIGVNPVDTYIRAGIYPLLPQVPYTPGLDAAGVVEATGPAVKHRKVGDRVYIFGSMTGSYAEQVLCLESQTYCLPDNVSFSAGATVGVAYATAYYALHYRAQAKPGETVLVHGASGSVGLAALQIAKAAGMRVIGTAGSEQGLKLLQENGAIAALDHTKAGYLSEIDKLTCGEGLDVILEMLAHVNLDNDLKQLGKGGRIVVIGNRGTITIDPRDTMGREAAILGMSLFNVSTKQLQQIHAALFAGLESGIYKPVVSVELPMVEAVNAHIKVMEAGAKGKIILIPVERSETPDL
ncbi:MAG TPA: NADPH:quinone reductase [Malonomonas sp.]